MAPPGPVASAVIGDGNDSVGAVRSIFTVTEAEFGRPAPLVAVQVSVVPTSGVSVSRAVVVQSVEEAIPDSGSDTVQLIVTGALFHPLPLALGVTVGVITGGVVSAELMVTVSEARIPVGTKLLEYWSVPEAEPENWIMPANVAVYVHVKVTEPPPAIVAEEGEGPEARAAAPVPERARLVGATASAEAVPVLWTVIVTVIVPPTITGPEDFCSSPPML